MKKKKKWKRKKRNKKKNQAEITRSGSITNVLAEQIQWQKKIPCGGSDSLFYFLSFITFFLWNAICENFK